jgi:hypothetical protein
MVDTQVCDWQDIKRSIAKPSSEAARCIADVIVLSNSLGVAIVQTI